jgi:hypothetical protein
MDAADRADARKAAARANDHLAVDRASEDRVRRADVAADFGRDRGRFEPESGAFHGRGRVLDDLVFRLAAGREREIEMLEPEFQSDHVGVEYAEGIDE